MNVYNQEPRPRVLFEAVPEPLFHELSTLVPTARLVQEKEKVYEAEYDLLVTYADNAGARNGKLHVLSIGSSRLGHVPMGPSSYLPPYVLRNNTTLAAGASIPSEIDNDLKRLLERTILETLPGGEKTAWSWPNSTKQEPQTLLDLGVEKLPYVINWPRTQGTRAARSLALPSHTSDIRGWFVWFLEHLHGLDPTTFPGEVEWASSPSWMTAQTKQLHDALETSENELSELIAAAKQKTRQAQIALETAVLADAQGLQRLLTADGEELESAVTEALELLGFDAKPMDDHHDATTRAKLEDLRVTDPDDPGWVCLVEIKGYSKGVKTNDINQITGKPLISYSIETGQSPAALWHIVNFKRSSDPAGRGEAVSNDLDLTHLADLGGMLIDTRQLYLAVRDVQLGELDAADVRNELKNSLMRWDHRNS